jgi:hypothetical protein
MTRIYWTPHKSRRHEREFVTWLHACFGGELLNERFPLAPSSLDYLLEKSALTTWLDADRSLALSRRLKCIDELSRLPAQIRVATKTTGISFDVVIQQAGHTYYWEYHELQHRNLKDDRPKIVYGSDEHEYAVSRCLQRLLRDVWRIKAFPNVSVVWDDWFVRVGSCSQPTMAHGFREYYLPDKFSFKSFCAQQPVR